MKPRGTQKAIAMPTSSPTPGPNELLYLYKSEDGYKAIMDLYEAMVKQIEVPIESHYVDARFGSTHMLVCGPEDAEPLILLQGVASGAPLWRHQIPALADYFRVYALDIVGQPGNQTLFLF